VGTCGLCGSSSVAGHSYRKVTRQDPLCADFHGIDLDLSGNGRAETMCDEGNRNVLNAVYHSQLGGVTYLVSSINCDKTDKHDTMVMNL